MIANPSTPAIVVVAAGMQTAAVAISSVNRRHGIDNIALVGDLYMLGADRSNHQSCEKDSVIESHGR